MQPQPQAQTPEKDEQRPPSTGTSPPQSIIITRIDPDFYRRQPTPETATRSIHQSATPNTSTTPAGREHELLPPAALQRRHATRASNDTATSLPSSSTALTVVSAQPPMSLTQRALSEAGSGLGGAIFSAICVYPMDLVMNRMRVPNSPYTSFLSSVAKIVREEGPLTLYTGLSSELVKTSVQNFSYFYWYYVFKEWATARLARRLAAEEAKLLALGSPQTTNSLLQGGDLIRHQATCTDLSCFCRSVGHLAAHTEAHRLAAAATQVDQWRAKAEKRRLSAAGRAQQHAAGEFDGNVFHPRLMPSVSEPFLAGLIAKHDIDDSPYVDVRSMEQTALVTNTATVHQSASSTAVAAAAPSPPPALPSSSASSPVLSIGSTLLLGTLAGCITQIVVNPIGIVQTRMMTQKRTGNSVGFFTLASQILANEGVGAFFAGILPSFILSTNPSIQFLVFDRLKALILRILNQSMIEARNLSILESFVLGAFSKIVATLLTYPYIVAKLRFSLANSPYAAVDPIRGMVMFVRDVLVKDGPSGFYTGIHIKILQSAISAGLQFAFREIATARLSKLMGKTP